MIPNVLIAGPEDDPGALDATPLLVSGGLPVIEMVENSAGMARFTLLNDYETPGHNLLGDCTLWEGRPRPLSTGMYVMVFDPVGVSLLMDGFITSIISNSETVDVEVGDGLAILGKQGTWIRRNFYGASSGYRWLDTAIDEDGKPYAIVGTQEGTIDTNQVAWTRFFSDDYPFNGDLETVYVNTIKEISYSPKSDYQIDRIELKLGMIGLYSTPVTATIDAYVDGLFLSQTIRTVTVPGDRNDKTAHASVVVNFSPPITYGNIILKTSFDAHHYVYVKRDKNDLTGSYTDTSGARISGRISAMMHRLKPEPISISSESTPSRIYPQTVEDWMKEEPLTDRVRVLYASEDLVVTDVMQNVADALGLQCIIRGSSSAQVAIARIGGGFALDYLKAMADVPDGRGVSRAFRVSGRGRNIHIGDRYRVSDPPVAHIAWGMDKVDGAIPFASFNPRMTMKGRPSLVTIRATTSEGLPIISTVEDVASTGHRGLAIESLSGTTSVSTDMDAVREAYGTLTSAELDRWEGSIVLPGIVQGMIEMTGDHTGSGVPVRITDSRNALRDYPARVRQVAYDYNAMTTTLQIGNLDRSQQNKVSDSIAMAQVGSDAAFSAASSASAYMTQYLRMTIPGIVPQSQNFVSIEVQTSEGLKVIELESISIGIMPSGVGIMQARAVSEEANAMRYAVKAIKINGIRTEIPDAIRPDFLLGQTLVVSVTIPS